MTGQMQPLAPSFTTLLDRRFLVVYLLGFSSGFPWVLHGSILTLWLQDAGFSRSAIGALGAIAGVYALNWTWAPFIDRLRLPVLHRLVGQRRSWILLSQALMIIFAIFLSQADPSANLLPVVLCGLGIAAASATQDVCVDAYRITLFSPAEMDEKIPYSAAISVAGWYSGFGFIGGALALWLGGETIGLDWPQVYRWLILVYLLLMVLVCMAPEPAGGKGSGEVQRRGADAAHDWLREVLLKPFLDFLQRYGVKLALGLLAFLFAFRLGEAMLGRMALLFYGELGFTTDQIAFYSKFLGGFSTIVFSLIGAFINVRFGIVRGILVGGIAMASSNLLYSAMAEVGPEPWLFILTLLIDNFTQAFATVTVVSFMSFLASRVYTGTQFALMTSISNFGRTTLGAASSGVVVDALGGNWTVFFILTALMVIPALLLLLWIGPLLRAHGDSK